MVDDVSCFDEQLKAAPRDDTAPADVDDDLRCVDEQLKAAPRKDTAPAASEKVIVYIAIAGDSHPDLLDREYFGTHGYIPAWEDSHDAVEALQKHLYGTIKITQYKYTVYKFSIVPGTFYMRPDKYHKVMLKLFFPLPLHREVPEASLQQVWRKKYQETYPYPHKWVWTCNFMENIHVDATYRGMLVLNPSSGRFI